MYKAKPHICPLKKLLDGELSEMKGNTWANRQMMVQVMCKLLLTAGF